MRRVHTPRTVSNNPFMPAPWMPDSFAKRAAAVALIAFACATYAIVLMGLLGRSF